MSENHYLSEEELARLIEETEQSGMLRAPSYLKREILEQAAGKKIVSIRDEAVKKSQEQSEKRKTEKQPGQLHGQTAANRSVMTWEQKKKAYRLYQIKVAGAAAAAILALFLIPMGTNMPQEKDNSAGKAGVMTEIHKQTNDWCSHLFEASNAFLAPNGDWKR